MYCQEKGALSALIEDEVGLWTTDVADEEIEQVGRYIRRPVLALFILVY